MKKMQNNLKEKVYKFIQSYGVGVSFVELKNAFDEFEGDKDFGLFEYNIILWTGISEQFVKVLRELIKDKKIKIVPTTPLVYVLDGTALRLPIAKRLKHRYKRPRWLPAVFNISDK